MNKYILDEYLDYNPDTGVFIWKRDSLTRKVKGKIAGCLSADGYVYIGLKGKKYKAHRLAFLTMTGRFPINQTDHINHKKNDNRWLNLRDATYSENAKNHPKQTNNTSGIVGVSWDSKKSLWLALISVDRNKIYLGRRKDKFLAICLRKSAEIKYGFHLNHGVTP